MQDITNTRLLRQTTCTLIQIKLRRKEANLICIINILGRLAQISDLGTACYRRRDAHVLRNTVNKDLICSDISPMLYVIQSMHQLEAYGSRKHSATATL